MAAFARFGLRGQFGSFLMQPAILPMPQPHSQSRSLSACMSGDLLRRRQVRQADGRDRREIGRLRPAFRKLALGLEDLRRHLGAGWRLAAHRGGGLTAVPAPMRARLPRPTKKPIASPVSSGQRVAINAGPREDESFCAMRGGLPHVAPRRVMRHGRQTHAGPSNRSRGPALDAIPLRRRPCRRRGGSSPSKSSSPANIPSIIVVDRLEVTVTAQLLTLELLEGAIDPLIANGPWASSLWF